MKCVTTSIRGILAAAAIVCAVLVPNAAQAGWVQQWLENGVGSFDSLGMTRISGSYFTTATDALTLNSGTTALSWTETNTADNAFASFAPSSLVYFSSHFDSPPSVVSSYLFTAWLGDVWKESAIMDWNGASWRITSVLDHGTRDELIAASTVPEPGTLLLAGLALSLLAFLAKKRPSSSDTNAEAAPA